MTTPTSLHCPKCAGEMVTYERAGVHVDQCRECRGVFLDRGELDRLIDLEAQATMPIRPEPMRPEPMREEPSRPELIRAGSMREEPSRDAGPPWARDRDAGRPRGDDDDDDDDRPWGRDGRYPEARGYDARSYPRSRKRSFLGELFEGFVD